MFSRVLVRQFPDALRRIYGVGGKFTSIQRAYEALRNVAPGLTQKQYAILLGQAKAETDFGDGFETPDGSESSNNWGAIYAPGDLGFITRHDTIEGKTVEVKAAWNSSPEVGARQFYELIRKHYDPALARAAEGDLWGYSEALWRDGPCNPPWQPKGKCPKRPSYYVGFPPGHRYGLAPASVRPGSADDRWYRITAYARFMSSGINAVNAALGWSGTYVVDPPPGPEGSSGMGTLIVLGGLAAGGWWLVKGGGLGYARRLIGG